MSIILSFQRLSMHRDTSLSEIPEKCPKSDRVVPRKNGLRKSDASLCAAGT